LLAGEATLLILSNGVSWIADAAWGYRQDGGIIGVASLLGIIFGAFLAARLAGHHGLFQGIVVGCGFIAVGAVFQFLQEASIVHASLSSGTRNLVDLGPMNMGSLMSGDLLALVAGSFGGLFARRP
jgi:hypothetical protein